MQITVRELLSLVEGALVGQEFPIEAAPAVAAEFVSAEVAGTKTHGVGKLLSMNLGDLQAQPSILQHGALISVDGRGGNGFLLLRQVSGLVGDATKHHGVAAASIRNFSRYSSLYPYTTSLAQRGLVGILMNSAGPAAVAPYQGIDPITGTNPICFSFPLPQGGVQTFDFATADVVWGEIRQATLEGRGLPSGPFFDATGDVTTVPSAVNAVRAFGGAKGWALNLAIEICAGLLSGAGAGSSVGSEFDCGALLLAIDPVFGAGEGFADGVASLLNEVRQSRPDAMNDLVRAPGDRARAQIELSEHADSQLTIPDGVLGMLSEMARGVRLSELASNPLYN